MDASDRASFPSCGQMRFFFTVLPLPIGPRSIALSRCGPRRGAAPSDQPTAAPCRDPDIAGSRSCQRRCQAAPAACAPARLRLARQHRLAPRLPGGGPVGYWPPSSRMRNPSASPGAQDVVATILRCHVYPPLGYHLIRSSWNGATLAQSRRSWEPLESCHSARCRPVPGRPYQFPRVHNRPSTSACQEKSDKGKRFPLWARQGKDSPMSDFA